MKTKEIPRDTPAENQVTAISSTKFDCAMRFAPEKVITAKDKNEDWITNQTQLLNERKCFTIGMMIPFTKTLGCRKYREKSMLHDHGSQK